MKIKKQDYLGIDHSKINKTFGGDLTFVNYMNIEQKDGYNYVAAVYHAANPDREKGHKDYMLLHSHYDPILLRSQMFVSGKTSEEIEALKLHDGLLCTKCDTVIISLSRHDCVFCDCENRAMIDGGRDYSRRGAMDLKTLRECKVNLLTDEVILVDEK